MPHPKNEQPHERTGRYIKKALYASLFALALWQNDSVRDAVRTVHHHVIANQPPTPEIASDTSIVVGDNVLVCRGMIAITSSADGTNRRIIIAPAITEKGVLYADEHGTLHEDSAPAGWYDLDTGAPARLAHDKCSQETIESIRMITPLKGDTVTLPTTAWRPRSPEAFPPAAAWYTEGGFSHAVILPLEAEIGAIVSAQETLGSR